MPDFSVIENLSLKRMYRISPLAIVAIVFFGITNAMIFGMFAVWATQLGLNNKIIGIALGCWTGGAPPASTS